MLHYVRAVGEGGRGGGGVFEIGEVQIWDYRRSVGELYGKLF